ncbi:hypothetical protein E1176_18905 [Fulvivirga sp. RKSG066]|uniref:hypothetical protein n=1 Tax=Fulvivirga aurantia TaxID=2529383 RepID=UPI0012BC090D|nr:hypothetical protein [Fulvivirga aurantia]MTI23106.1 hypothetical protein [Fulvivirga aurantia]
MTESLTERAFDHFEEAINALREATSLTKADKANKLVSQIDQIAHSEEGIQYLYKKSPVLVKLGVFDNTAWAEPEKLVPQLVNGTLKAGTPHSSFEILSELRMLSIALGDSKHKAMSKKDAATFLEEVLVHNLEFVFESLNEETRSAMSALEQKKVFGLFKYLLSKSDLQGIKDKLAEEITLICEQRPIVTSKAREIIKLVKEKIELDTSKETDAKLAFYIDAIYHPSEAVRKHGTQEKYNSYLQSANDQELAIESDSLGKAMRSSGLVSSFHAILLEHLSEQNLDEHLPKALGLNDTGKAEFVKHKKEIKKLIHYIVHPDNAQCVYGLSRMLEKGLFSRQAVRAGLDNIKRIRLHSEVEKNIIKSIAHPGENISALQYLIGALIRVLGQPLGVGQGNNPTCQSARGISMWSQHAPAKLINMVITAATLNNLSFRFEGKEIEADKLGHGLVKQMDFSLDAVSVVLVPLLDKIYNEMMKLAAGREDDPHKWVNPAMYGQWIQIGFASVYNYLLNAIQDYEGFIKILYASCHPDYNGHHRLVYPNPVGIFITSSRGDMIGFHAVSLLRVRKDNEGVMRAYFLNPNNEGRQDWGQDIKPAVMGNGEKPGESSLPFNQFASRIYAFHYNTLQATDHLNEVPKEIVKEVKKLAQDSWGRSYTWNEIPRQW